MDILLVIIVVAVIGLISLFIIKGIQPIQQKTEKIKMNANSRGIPKIIDERFGEGKIVGGEQQSAHSFDLFIDMGTVAKPNVKKIPYYDWQIEPVNTFDMLTSDQPVYMFREKLSNGKQSGNGERFDKYREEEANNRGCNEENRRDALREVDRILERISGQERAKKEKQIISPS